MLSEPFNPARVASYRGTPDFAYRRAAAPDPVLRSFAEQVFRGLIVDTWIDREINRDFTRYRLMKEARADG